MNLKEHRVIFSSENEYTEPIMVEISEADEIKIQVNGSGSCEIEVLGKIHPSSEYLPLTILQDIDYTFTDKIIKSGFYSISTEGITTVKINVISYDNDMSAYFVTGGWSE